MAVFAISNSNNRAEDMETAPTVADVGAGAGGGQESVTFFQGANSISRKVTNTAERGTGTTLGATVDMTAAGDNRVWLSKTFVSDYLDINSIGWRVSVGSTTTDRYFYILFDDGTLASGQRDVSALLPRGGWYIYPVDPNEAAWRDGAIGTPSLTAADTFNISVGLATGAAKSENVFIDAIDLGDGLYGVGGDGVSTPGDWNDFLAADQGSATTGRIGHVNSNDAGLFVFGKITRGRTAAGTSTLTEFEDITARTIAWPGGAVAAGWNALRDDCATANTIITEVGKTFVGNGRVGRKLYFSPWRDDATYRGDVNDTNETVEIVGHGLQTGDYVLFSVEESAAPTGLTDATSYFVRAVSVDLLSFYTTRANAYSDTSRQNLTGRTSGSGGDRGEVSITLTPDTRPDYINTGTASGSEANYTSCRFVRYRDLTPTAANTFTTCNFVQCNTITLAGETYDGCVFDEPTRTRREAFMSGTRAEIELVTGCTFVRDDSQPYTGGHAIEITGTAGSLTLEENTLAWAANETVVGQGTPFNTETDVTSGSPGTITITGHGWATGDEVVYSKYDPSDGTLGTESISSLMSDGEHFFVDVIDADTISLYYTRKAALNAPVAAEDVTVTPSSAGNGETHTFYDPHAAVVNNTGGAVTINVTNGTSPVVRNIGASTTTVTNTVTITIDTDGITNFEARVFLTGTSTVVAETQDNGGTDRWSFGVGAAVAVDIEIMKLTPIAYEYYRKNNISFSTTQDFPVSLRVDRNDASQT